MRKLRTIVATTLLLAAGSTLAARVSLLDGAPYGENDEQHFAAVFQPAQGSFPFWDDGRALNPSNGFSALGRSRPTDTDPADDSLEIFLASLQGSHPTLDKGARAEAFGPTGDRPPPAARNGSDFVTMSNAWEFLLVAGKSGVVEFLLVSARTTSGVPLEALEPTGVPAGVSLEALDPTGGFAGVSPIALEVVGPLAVPEPATSVLLAAGVLALLARRRHITCRFRSQSESTRQSGRRLSS